MRLMILLAFVVMSMGIASCDYGMAPGETDGQSMDATAGGQRSSGLVIPSPTMKNAPVISNEQRSNNQPQDQPGEQDQTDEQGNRASEHNATIGTKVSPFKAAVPGTKAHGDPKTW